VQKKSSLASISSLYPEVVEEIDNLSFSELIEPPKHLKTAKDRFNLQRILYIKLSEGHDISWEEAMMGVKPLPSFTAPREFYKGLKIIKMPKEIIEEAEKSRLYALAILNHPERIKNLVESQKTEFKKPSLGHSRVLDRAEHEHSLLNFSDIASVQPDLSSNRLHRRKLFAAGPFIPTSLKKKFGVRLPLSTGSMITGNPELIAAAAMSGSLATTYKEGLCHVPKIQSEVTKEAVNIIYEAIQDPFWSKRKDKKVLLDFWLSQIGITVGPEVKEAVERVRLVFPLIKTGKLKNLAVRIYNPQVSKETVETVKRLRKEFGDSLEIFAGQANSVEAAQELVEAGADAIGQGIAGGLRCTTSIVSGVAVSVLRDLWRMRGKVDAPIFVDSSVSYYWSLAFLLGASMLVKPSHFVGIESIGGRYPFYDGSDYYIPYSGEASGINKEHLGKLMKNGRPFAPEGVGGFGHINLQLPTVPDQVLDSIINFLVPPFVFQGTMSGRRFEKITDMHKEADLDFLWELSNESRRIRGAWGPTFHKR
jgi:hypothetical protein